MTPTGHALGRDRLAGRPENREYSRQFGWHLGTPGFMVFSSLTFVCLFLPVVVAAYFLSPSRSRNLVLVIASVVFYAWSIPLAVVLVLSLIAINFGLGEAIEKRTGDARYSVIVVGIGLNLLVLISFKYADFLLENLNALLGLVSDWRVPLPHIALPLGISFFTFHIISYLVDVYRGSVHAQKSRVAFTLYIINFPQLIAGPIIRYHQISDQLQQRTVRFADIDLGVGRFTTGLAKKLIVANPIGAVADQIFTVSPDQLTSGTAWLGVLCYGLQIYFDFSGYSDMAIGIARIFGFRFPENFNYPYSAMSIQDFWRRWHITLSLWFRDYVYIPLGGNRHGLWKTARNLWIVFFLAGVWHGASWNFIIWGLWHGLFLWLERLALVEATFSRLPKFAHHGYAMFVVFIGWVFFRSPTLDYAIGFLARMGGFGSRNGGLTLSVNVSTPMMVLIAVACGIALPLWPRLRAMDEEIASRPGGAIAMDLTRMVLVGVVMMLSLATMAVEAYNPFIYFQF
jgi:alginate O-acetyltransferase complex protein AlgI